MDAGSSWASSASTARTSPSGTSPRGGTCGSDRSPTNPSSRPTTNRGIPCDRTISQSTSAGGATPSRVRSASSATSSLRRGPSGTRRRTSSCSSVDNTSEAARLPASWFGRAVVRMRRRLRGCSWDRASTSRQNVSSAQWASSRTITTGVSALSAPTASTSRSSESWRPRVVAHRASGGVGVNREARPRRTTDAPESFASSSAASRVFPIPAVPSTTATRSSPVSLRRRSARSSRSSRCRPTNGPGVSVSTAVVEWSVDAELVTLDGLRRCRHEGTPGEVGVRWIGLAPATVGRTSGWRAATVTDRPCAERIGRWMGSGCGAGSGPSHRSGVVIRCRRRLGRNDPIRSHLGRYQSLRSGVLGRTLGRTVWLSSVETTETFLSPQ